VRYFGIADSLVHRFEIVSKHYYRLINLCN
jgi:hypothetical protein